MLTHAAVWCESSAQTGLTSETHAQVSNEGIILESALLEGWWREG